LRTEEFTQGPKVNRANEKTKNCDESEPAGQQIPLRNDLVRPELTVWTRDKTGHTSDVRARNNEEEKPLTECEPTPMDYPKDKQVGREADVDASLVNEGDENTAFCAYLCRKC
jgi:hypothetical protein